VVSIATLCMSAASYSVVQCWVNFISAGLGRQQVDCKIACQEVLLIWQVGAMCSVLNTYAVFCHMFHILIRACGRRRSM